MPKKDESMNAKMETSDGRRLKGGAKRKIVQIATDSGNDENIDYHTVTAVTGGILLRKSAISSRSPAPHHERKFRGIRSFTRAS